MPSAVATVSRCNIGTIGVGETRWVLVSAVVDSCDDLVNQATVDWNDPGFGDNPVVTPDANTSNTVTTVVTCGSITIVKDTDPETTGIAFDFTGSFPGFDLEDDQSISFDNLEPGSYVITESNLPGNWDLTDITCTNAGLNGDVAGTINVGTETATINLRAGDDITCLFNNVETTVNITGDEEPTPTPTATPPSPTTLRA